MDVGPIQFWKEGNSYKKHDIVQVGNLPYPDPSTEIKYFNEEGSDDLHLEAIRITSSGIHQAGEIFDIESSIEYVASCMIRKTDSSASLSDEYRTVLRKKYTGTMSVGAMDPSRSIGIGIGIEFYTENNNLINVDDDRYTTRLMAGSELDHIEWLNVQLHIRQESVPAQAKKAKLVLLCFGHSSGTFDFTNIEARPANRFFYCMEDHNSSTSPFISYNTYWTQEFFWKSAYGGTAQFSAINENLKIGEGGDYVNNLAINSLPMSLNLQFDNKTDKEARAIVHFLQEKFFAYDSIFSLDYKGERLLSSEVQSFKFNYTYPYKKDLRYTCTNFNHSIPYRNKHTISATFICNTGSTLQSAESHAGYNKKLDGILPVTVEGTVKFEKGVPITLKTYATQANEVIDIEAEITKTREDEIREENKNTSSIDLTPIVDRISRYPEDKDELMAGGTITFNIDYDLEIGSCVFIKIDNPVNSIFDVGLAVIEGRLAANKYYFIKLSAGVENDIAPPLRPIADEERSPLESDSVDDDLISMETDTIPEEYGYSLVKLSRCPWNCLSTSPLIPDGMESIPKEFMDSEGNPKDRTLFLPNYRRVQLNSDIVPEMEEVTLTPLDNFEMNESFDLIIPAIHGRSSIYLDSPDEIQKYPYLKIRNFEQRPSQSFTIDHTPDHIQSEFTKVYNKKFKRGINQNLSTFNVTFNQRSDKEAKEILQFLESHLGYKKFRFQMPRPYLSDTEYHTSLSGKSSCIFYCPSWTHVVKYKNNHTINATFIESNTFEIEDLTKVFGLGEGRTPEGPCYEAEIYNFITKYEICTFSSILEAAVTYAEGRDFMDDDVVVQATGKQVDMVFIIDTENEMFSSIKYINDNGQEESQAKIDIVIDVLKKMATAYGIYVCPGTEDYGQGSKINAPNISEGVPPWPVNNRTGESLAQESFNDFQLNYPSFNNHTYKFSESYDSTQTRRFKVKIGLKEVNIGIVLVDEEKPVTSLVGGGKNQIIDYETVTEFIETTRTITPSTDIDEKIFPEIREGSAEPGTGELKFIMDLKNNSNELLGSVDVKYTSGGTSFEDTIHRAIKLLVGNYLSAGNENDSWMTFVYGVYNNPNQTSSTFTFEQGLMYYTWIGDRMSFTNQINNETKEVKSLKRRFSGKNDPGDNETNVWVFVYNEQGIVQTQNIVIPDIFVGKAPAKDSKMVAWVDTADTLRGYTGGREGGDFDDKDDIMKIGLTVSEKETLATQARAYALYYADQDGVLPQPYTVTDVEERTEKKPIFSNSNENTYFDKYIIYNKLENLSIEKKTEINYLNAAREALYQLFFSTRAQTVTDRFIFMIGRGNPGKSAINLLNEVRENRDLALRRPNDYDLFREKIITDERPPVRYSGKKMLPWYEENLQTRVIFAGIMSAKDGPSESGKKYAYDYYDNTKDPHGHLPIASDRLERISELGSFMDIFKTIEILCTDTGYQNMFKVTVHNCGPHDVKLLNTLVSSYNEDEPIKYTTELLASGIPKGGFSNDIKTISAGSDLTVSMGIDDDTRLSDDEENIITAEAEEDDPVAMVNNAMDNSFTLGEGGQFFADPYNTNLLDSRNNRQNITWESFNTKYEVHRAGVPHAIDGGWGAHKQESRGVYNDGVAFKNMPVRVFRLQSGLEILDYNIGNVSSENQKRGTYEHIPKIKPGEEIDLFFGIRSATYDINDRATGGFEDVQLVFNAEDDTMNKMDSYANVMLKIYGQKIKFDFMNQKLDKFFPYGLETPEVEEVEEEEEDPVVSPVQGTWEFSGSTLYTDMTMTVELGPAITKPDENGDPLSNNDGQIVGKASFRSNVDLDLFDNKKLWNTVSDNEDVSEEQPDGTTMVVASLPAGKATQYASYSGPALSPSLGASMDTVWDGSYLLRDKELIIFSNAQGAGEGQKNSTGDYIRKNLEYENVAVTYDAIDGSTVFVEDPRTTVFQYKFTFDETSDTESDSGSGNNWQTSLTAAGHGDYYILEGTWADPRLTGGQPSMPTITDPEASASWIGNAGKSKSAKITRL